MSLAEEIVRVIDKEFGKEFKIQSLSGQSDCGVEEWISTGSMLVNGVIHRPGIPIGKLTTIIGPPGSGKTTLAMHIMKEVQAIGGLVVLQDTEHAYDPERGARIGIDNSSILLYQDLYLEQAFSVITRIANTAIENKSPQPIVIIMDSHSATPTKAEVDAEPDATRGEIASSARLTSFHLRRLFSSGMLVKARVALVFICQPKSTVGGPPGFGPPPATYIAKNPIDFHATLILKLLSRSVLKTKDGIAVKVRCTKNKVGSPYSECKIEIMNDDGISEMSPLLDIAVEAKLVEARGAYYQMEGREKSFRRREWPDVLQENPALRRTLSGICSGIL